MALSLIYGKKYAQSSVNEILSNNSDIPVVTFDTMVTEEHRYMAHATYFPVERGTIVSDHIINQPAVVVLSGLVTDTPLNILAPFNRSIAAFNTLVQIYEKKQIVNIVTGIKVYPRMCITSLSVPRTMRTGQTLTFNIELQQINFDDTFDTLLSEGNVFAGVRDTTPRASILNNTQIPVLDLDPPFSLKDQAESLVNVGVQSLASIPIAVQPNVLTSLAAIVGA